MASTPIPTMHELIRASGVRRYGDKCHICQRQSLYTVTVGTTTFVACAFCDVCIDERD